MKKHFVKIISVLEVVILSFIFVVIVNAGSITKTATLQYEATVSGEAYLGEYISTHLNATSKSTTTPIVNTKIQRKYAYLFWITMASADTSVNNLNVNYFQNFLSNSANNTKVVWENVKSGSTIQSAFYAN